MVGLLSYAYACKKLLRRVLKILKILYMYTHMRTLMRTLTLTKSLRVTRHA